MSDLIKFRSEQLVRINKCLEDEVGSTAKMTTVVVTKVVSRKSRTVIVLDGDRSAVSRETSVFRGVSARIEVA
jgi:hypothetical protein